MPILRGSSIGGRKSVRPNSSGRELDYPTCDLETIKTHLAMASKGEGNKVLFLWTIDKYLFEAQEIAEQLGFKLHARMIWDKVTGIPAAFTVRFGHEYLLYMYRGKLTPVAKEERGKIHTVFREKATKHSKNLKLLIKSSNDYIQGLANLRCMREMNEKASILGATSYKNLIGENIWTIRITFVTSAASQ